ncbi:hypothetical protein K7A38_20545 [Escherichia fergusonii]|uniref:hypothetical protein n=1 Tax=Escherichia fergusonii TaxID=564 RepID=UPI001C9B24C0|nr:hypothetical protein [Escherichia fergusonii]MBY7518316.1 hypothetical protein [Escherichia fergusonii]
MKIIFQSIHQVKTLILWLMYLDPLGLKECIGSARVLQGNSRLVGKCGGYNTRPSNLDKYGVTTDSTAIIPSQWGFRDKPSARNKINSISGKLKADGTQLFSQGKIT